MASLTLTKLERGNRTRSLSMPEAARLLSREERFMATVAAMNTLLIEKQIYTQQEFDAIFCDWAAAQVSKSRKKKVR
jgi:hypothetical protein